ncbi:DUF3090 family protein [Phytoactinopolyspora halotolerans]|uniref:DUF3090 family protein n=1 Tax=Phytoactinopolyspora halotolerans TaxID=1981512 RepID=A0A6L9SBB5_9ACTN|nr:DUF3090 family protein [Phytoactinopolyspora halotolerans]NEE01300.1 DUF3090 family protein [Phytoactinopolyspora halotolerans]
MAVQVFRFDSPERFVAGTVGEPGERTFFLQARDKNQLASVVLEKEQVAVLAERVDAMLDEIVRRTEGQAAIPSEAPPEAEDLAPLEQPIVEEFRVGTLTLAWEGEIERVVITAYAAGEAGAEEEAEEEPPENPEDSSRDVFLVKLTAGEARAFAKRAQALVAAGRPPCPLCGLALEPEGHICPRQNGYRRRD